MPPARRAPQEDSRPEDFVREKLKGLQSGGGRGKRANNIANGTNLREIATSNSLAAATNGTLEQSQNGGSIINWNDVEDEVLHRYRHTHRLSTPSAFTNPIHPIVLSPRIGLGLGKHSPTMARAHSKRRITKEQLALAVRKSFNSLAVSETEVIANLQYKVKNQDKTFRIKFAPPRRTLAESGGGIVDPAKVPPNQPNFVKGAQLR